MSKVQSPSQPTEAVELFIHNLSHEGRGVALYDEHPSHDVTKRGKKVFVRYALAGETVAAKITRVHKRFEEADALEVLANPSPHRVVPVCAHFGQCGGCVMQHIQPIEQINFKQKVVASHLQHFANLVPDEWLPAMSSERADYRRRVRLGLRYHAQAKRWVLGFRAAKSNHLINIDHCAILDQRFSQELPALKQCLTALKRAKVITHIELVAGDEELALVVRHVEKLAVSDVEDLLSFVKKRMWQLYLQPNCDQSLTRVDTKNATMRLHYRLAEFDLRLAFSPLDFTQVNAAVNQKMVHLACQLLDLKLGERVLDLFCGLGNFSLPLAKCVGPTGQVVAVEGVLDMVQRGQENARANQIENVAFHCQNLMQDFSDQIWAQQGFDAIVIDPPRAGAEQVMHYLAKFAASRIVYVSCDPATLARDAGILSQNGYRLLKVGVMDMFSHTEHVESIALFERVQVPVVDEIK